MLLTGCGTAPYSKTPQDFVPTQTEWINAPTPSIASANIQQILALDHQLIALFDETLTNNADWQAALTSLQQAELGLVTQKANRYPHISLSASAVANGSKDKSIQTNHNQSGQVSANWEVDVWGKLSDQQKSAELSFQSAQINTQKTRQNLLVKTAQTWLNAITAQQLLALYEQRLISLTSAQDIIEKGYQRGLNSALELNLGRNTLASEQARTQQQRQSLLETTATLQTLLGRYPSGTMDIASQLPTPSITNVLALPPAEVLEQRHDLQSAWLNLLAANINVAVAHKRRFPTLNLSAAINKNEGNPSTWSFLSSITAPLFDAGKLKADEKIAAIKVQELEANYLQTLRNALEQIETTIAKANNLAARYQTKIKANDTAQLSYQLAIRQYQLGLTSFSTLLESQRRAFDAEASLIQLQNQWAQNQFNLALALGLELQPLAQKGNPL